MKIMLLAPPDNLSEVLGDGKVFSPPVEPYGLLYIAAVLEEKGHQVSVYDAFLVGHSPDQVIDHIVCFRPLVIGISVLTATGVSSFHLGKKLKERLPESLVVLGNVHAEVFAPLYLENHACDLVVHGEGEETFLEICETVKGGQRDFSRIRGVSMLKDGKTWNSGAIHEISDLNQLPFPSRHLIDFEAYKGKEAKRQVFTVFTSRSCVFRCKFCVVNSCRYRVQSVERTLAEMEQLMIDYPKLGRRFFFGDPLFTGNRKRIFALCEEIIRRKMNIKFECEGHINTLDEDLLKIMKKAGLISLSIGFESGDDEVLKAIGKKTNTEKGRRVAEIAHGLGIDVMGLFILGLPGETMETMGKTIAFALSLPLFSAQFSVFCPYPGSAYYEECVKPPTSLDEALASWNRFTSYPSFGTGDMIYTPEGLTREQLIHMQRKAIRSFYLRPSKLLSYRVLRSRISLRNVLQVIKAASHLFR